MSPTTPTPIPATTNPLAPTATGRVWRVGTLTYTTGGLVVLFIWLLCGDFAWSMRDRSVAPMAQWYLNHIGVPNFLFGLLVSSFPAAIALILGPIISVKSDRHRGPRGRRIPFLLVTTPVAALGMIGLGLTPIISRSVHALLPDAGEMTVALICFGVFWAAFEFATIAGQSVFGGLINDVVPKQLLGRFYGLFRAISLIDGMIFNFWIMGKVPAHFTLILCIVGVFYGTAFMWVCLKVREGNYPPPLASIEHPMPDIRQRTGIRGFITEIRVYCRECFANPYYLAVFVMLMAASISLVPVNVFTIPYARSLGVDMDVYGRAVALTFLISLCLSFFLGWLADLFHPLRMVMVTLAGYAIVTLWGGLYGTTPFLFLAAWVGHGVLGGCYFTSAASLGQRLFPHTRFAQFASAGGMFVAIGNMVMAPAMGALIDATGKLYRLTFFTGCALSLVALACAFIVHARFMKLGGPKNYAPPE
ncbi:MFS transporter [Opitutaceae bacterium TAV4]|nr:MFS transporter [Opitutaceae bacterium TAV4]RRJ99915.1 MFS transporter [Opitutaceae bacterium TAV3]